jgi:hypothetical protein
MKQLIEFVAKSIEQAASSKDESERFRVAATIVAEVACQVAAETAFTAAGFKQVTVSDLPR